MENFNLAEQRNALRNAMRGLPRTCGELAVQFFKSRFREGGWRDAGFQKWAPRKKKKGAEGRAVLIKRGRLRRSIRITNISGPDVTVGTDVPYAKIHNEGGTIARHARSETFVRNRYVRGPKGKMFGGKGAFKRGTKAGRGQSYKAHEVRMPKRQFMGESAHLTKIIGRKITSTFLKALQ